MQPSIFNIDSIPFQAIYQNRGLTVDVKNIKIPISYERPVDRQYFNQTTTFFFPPSLFSYSGKVINVSVNRGYTLNVYPPSLKKIHYRIEWIDIDN